MARENYEKMMDMANKQLIPNDVEFDCPICIVPIEVGEGVKLRECLHHCCKYIHMLKCQSVIVTCLL